MKILKNQDLFYEDFIVGATLYHGEGRVVTQLDNELVSELIAYRHPLHTDAAYAKSTEFGGLILSSIATFSIVYGMSCASLSRNAIANVEWKNVQFVKPVYLGDVLYAKSEILFKRGSQSRKAQGIVQVKTSGVNQHGDLVNHFERVFLVLTHVKELITLP